MAKSPSKDEIRWSRRAGADLRIQLKDDFAKIIKHKRYTEYRNPQESSIYRRFMHISAKKKVGKAYLIEGAEIQSAVNKGYPIGFTNYDTYDPKHEKRYKKRLRKRVGRNRNN